MTGQENEGTMRSRAGGDGQREVAEDASRERGRGQGGDVVKGRGESETFKKGNCARRKDHD